MPISNEEVNLVKMSVSMLSNLPIMFPDDYQAPLSEQPGRVPVFPIDIPLPPQRKAVASSTGQSDSRTITFKSLKPAKTFTLTVNMTDTIASIKDQLAAQPGAPSADAQRLLHKGKALVDGKLLKEYDLPEGEATINLMIKPGNPLAESPATISPTADPSSTITPPVAGDEKKAALSPILTGTSHARSHSLSHSRSHSRNQSFSDIPSVVLSTPEIPSSGRSSPSLTIPLSLDTISTSMPPSSASGSAPSSFHSVVAEPQFWADLRSFLKERFKAHDDADSAFEEFLLASKGHLTPHEIAKIRDQVGIVGMAGH